MKFGPTLREKCQVVMHLNEGFTKVSLDGTRETGLADGVVSWDIPTHLIPVRLRRIGSRLVVVRRTLRPEPNDSVAELRLAANDVLIEPLIAE